MRSGESGQSSLRAVMHETASFCFIDSATSPNDVEVNYFQKISDDLNFEKKKCLVFKKIYRFGRKSLFNQN